LTGLIPLVLALVGLGFTLGPANGSGGQPAVFGLPLATVGLVAALAMYLAAIISMIVCLATARLRFIGYGLLAAVVASPVVFFIGCLAALNGVFSPA
jgi:hypothetical protein